MSSPRRPKTPLHVLTMHGWTAKHYILSVILILVVMGMFAYSWS